MKKRFQVFVSSTYTDLIEERKEVTQAILKCNCFPAGMELFPASNKTQWDIIKRVIEDSDFYLLIIAGRYGSLGTDDYGKKISYTEMEFDYALSLGKPIIVMLHKDPDSLPSKLVEKGAANIQKLIKFREKAATDRMISFWENKDQLHSAVLDSLHKIMNDNPKAVGWVRADKISTNEILYTNYKAKQKSIKKALISGDNFISLKFNIFNRGETKYEESSFFVQTTWNNILKQIGPLLIEERIRYTIEEAICEIGINKHIKKLNDKNKILNFKKNQYINISKQSIGEILVQFLALNYIEVKHPNHNNDYSLSTESTYVLTEVGRKKLLELAAKYE